jgi:arabinose-5-phosphate isomerase
MLLNQDDISQVKASDITSKNPKIIDKNQLAKDAMQIMKDFNIGQLIVTDKGKYYGIIDIHTLLDEGII